MIRSLAETPIRREQYQEALRAAREALESAYQPYSQFRVGAGILCADGSVFKGCNLETANYDGTHAEEAALCAMVGAGRRDPVLCVCMAALEGAEPSVVMSCGKCRQVIYEFSSLTGGEIWLPFITGSKPEMEAAIWLVKISDLLPYAFGPADIGVDLAKYRR